MSKPEIEAKALLNEALSITQQHLAQMQRKLTLGSTLTAQEGFTICSYIKTLVLFEKANKDMRKEYSKALGDMSDAELEAELKKHAALITGETNESEDTSETP